MGSLPTELLLVWRVNDFDGPAVLFVFEMTMRGQGEAPAGLYPFGVWRYAHPVGLRHTPKLSAQLSLFLHKCFSEISFAFWN